MSQNMLIECQNSNDSSFYIKLYINSKLINYTIILEFIWFSKNNFFDQSQRQKRWSLPRLYLKTKKYLRRQRKFLYIFNSELCTRVKVIGRKMTAWSRGAAEYYGANKAAHAAAITLPCPTWLQPHDLPGLPASRLTLGKDGTAHPLNSHLSLPLTY